MPRGRDNGVVRDKLAVRHVFAIDLTVGNVTGKIFGRVGSTSVGNVGEIRIDIFNRVN